MEDLTWCRCQSKVETAAKVFSSKGQGWQRDPSSASLDTARQCQLAPGPANRPWHWFMDWNRHLQCVPGHGNRARSSL